MNCDPIARWYWLLEYIGFGRALEHRRCAFLPDVADARRVLLLGDGDGRFLAHLAELNREASIDYIDLSGSMLELARKRVDCGRVNFLHADALSVALPRAGYDLVVTHFFLDCFDRRDLTTLIERVSLAMTPNSRWLISEFRDTPWSPPLIALLYFFFRITTGLRTRCLTDHRPMLQHKGFRLASSESARFGLLVSEVWTHG